VAEAYLKQANARLRHAREALDDGLNAYALRLAQECVELSLKAALRVVGVEYPRKHDVSDILGEVEERFPSWFRRELPELKEASKKLTAMREVSMYGNELEMLSPDEVVDRKLAEKAVRWAIKAHKLCSRLFDELKEGSAKLG